jgi:hypothetical protein
MAYDEMKDVAAKTWRHEGGLIVSVMLYNGGDPKLQIGPRQFTKHDGTTGFGKAGRLNVDEVRWLMGLNGQILEAMDDAAAARKFKKAA